MCVPENVPWRRFLHGGSVKACQGENLTKTRVPALNRQMPASRSVLGLAELEDLVAHEDEHVADLVRLVLLHREDHAVRAARAEVVHEDVQELAQDLRVVVDREGVDRVQDDEGGPGGGLSGGALD